ncbi:MAG: CDP-alcohol phosphatidyltransferase family protein [Ignisphaera sp.]
MIGIILAAGYGTRLHPITLEMPKTMIELEPGVSILDYIVSAFKDVEISEIYVATREDVSHFFLKRGDVKVLVVDVKEGDGNLWTLYQAISSLKSMGIEDDVVLSMSDHVYEYAIIRKLVKAARNSSKLYICLDKLIRGRDAVEGLKIVVDGNTVVLSGKNIPPYSGIDTGLFFIPKSIFPYIEKIVLEKGRKASLSDMINALAKENLVGYVDVSGYLWQDVDTLEDVERVRKLYWKILSRNLVKDSDGVVSRYINRRISTAISISMYKARVFIHPNILTVIVFIIGVVASILLFTGHDIVGALLALLSSILDGVDGEVARLYNAKSRFGAMLDTLLDRIVDVLLLSAIFYQMVQGSIQLGNTILTVYVLLYALSLLGSIYVSYISNVIEDKEYVASLRSQFPWATRDVRIFVLALATVFKAYEYGLMYIAFSSWVFIARSLAHSFKSEAKTRSKLFTLLTSRRQIKPYIEKPFAVLIEETIFYLLLLAILIPLTNTALAKINSYVDLDVKSPYPLLWEFIASIEIATIVYLFYRFMKGFITILTTLKNKVVEKLWITPTVYQRIIKRGLILALIMLSTYPINYVMALAGVEKEIKDLGNYILMIITFVAIVMLLLDIAKAFEHIIRGYILKKNRD